MFLCDLSVSVYKVKRRNTEEVMIGDRYIACKSLFVLDCERHLLTSVNLLE